MVSNVNHMKSNSRFSNLGGSFRIAFVLALSMVPMASCSHAQQANPNHLVDHKPLMNLVWKTFDQLMYKVTQKDGQPVYTPHFPENLQRLNGKTVTIKGYMVPIEPGRRHHTFLLSVLPVYQCMFCGQNGIPPMVEISMDAKTKLAFGEEPISIRGVVYLNATDDTRSDIQLRNAIRHTGAN